MKLKITYWLILGFFSLMMAASGIQQLSGSTQMVEGLRHLGYPDYFRVILGVAKLLGVVGITVTLVPNVVREWAYAGFGITLIVASISHAVTGDPLANIVSPVIALLLMATARLLYSRVAKTPAKDAIR